jgi:RND family efflux transporter MFP subunit
MTMEDMQMNATSRQDRQKHRGRWVALAIALLALGGVIAGGVWQRIRAEASLGQATEAAAITTVDVVHPAYDSGGNEIVLPGNAEAYFDTAIYARTSGYLKNWYFDIGSHVRKGQLLAEIEAPELDQQLQQARANLATAHADMDLARITANRSERLLKTSSIAVQERDNAVAAAASSTAAVDASAAEVARLEELKAYQRIYAPFDGVITARNTDFGTVINAGAGGISNELFHISAIDKLRVFVAIPEVWSRYARPGITATLKLAEFPSREFPCTLVRTANAIDPSTRTLLTEFDVDNRAGELLPGSYVQLRLKLPGSASVLTVPANTLLFRQEGPRAAVVRNGRTQLVPITIGHDYGVTVEILSGLKAEDEVILDPSDSLIDGLPVRIHGVQGSQERQ